MAPHEVFRVASELRSEGAENRADAVLDFYWAVELEVCRDESWSDVQLCDKEERTCAVCGFVAHTEEDGKLPSKCPNEKCRILWEFFSISKFPKAYSFTPGRRKEMELRITYLKSHMDKLFGCLNLRAVPPEVRFDFLLTTMLERVAHEANNRRTQGSPV